MQKKSSAQKRREKREAEKLEAEYRDNPALKKLDELTKWLEEYNRKNPPKMSADEIIRFIKG